MRINGRQLLESSAPRVVGQSVVIDAQPLSPLAQPKRKASETEDEQQSALIKKSNGEETILQPSKKSKIPVAISAVAVKRTQVEDNGAVDVEQSKASKIDLPEANYPASGLKLSLHGTAYQLKLLMLFLKRGLKKGYAFRLATEMDAAEKFDDVVFEYRQRNKSHYRFLQAKHKQDDAEKITAYDLLKEKKGQNKQKNNFSLQKYFNSYRKIKEKSEFKDGEIDDVIIYTNIGFDVEVTARDSQLKKLAKKELYVEKVETTDDVLDVGGERYRMASRSHQDKRDKVIAELFPLFERGSDLKQLATLLAHYLFVKKDGVGNSQRIGLNEPLFKQYHHALAKEVIDVDDKKFYAKFLEDQSLSPSTQTFRNTFRDAVHCCLQSKKNLTTEDKALLGAFTDRPVSKIPLSIASDRQLTDKEQAFWRQIGKKTFNLSEQFGKVFKLESNPQLTDSQKFADEMAALMKKSSDNSVKIERRKKVIKDNINKLAGHVLVYRDEEEGVYFSTRFLQLTHLLPRALQIFREHLKTTLEQQEISFDTLNQYQLTISQFQTCQEQALEEHFTEETELPEKVTTQEIEAFIDKLVIAVNQPNEIELEGLINSELGEEFNLIDSDLVASQIQKEMFNWFKKRGKENGKEGKFLSRTGGEEIFAWARQKVNSLMLIGPTLDYQVKMKEFGIDFNDDAFEKLHNFFSAQQQILHLVAPEKTLLSAIKVYKAFADRPEYKQDDSYLFMRLSQLLRIQKQAINAFASANSHHLFVIECKSEAQKISILYKQLYDIFKRNPKKKIILITQKNDMLMSPFKTPPEIDNNSFSDLTANSQQTLLGISVKFQGKDIYLNHLITATQRQLLDTISPEKLIEKEPLVIGKELQIPCYYDEDYYISRTFNQMAIKKDIFKAKKEQKFLDLLASTEEEFKQLCQQHPVSNIHWLKSESGQFIWQQSQGCLTALRKYIDTHQTHSCPPEKLNDFLQQAQRHKVMLISDTAGMGKSTVLTYLSKKIKAVAPAHWVVRFDLNEHTDALKKNTDVENKQINETFTPDSAVEFLSKELLKLETPLEQALFKQCFKQDGKVKVALMLDGFDEISPNYKETVINLLQILKKTSVEQMWVTTRPHMKEALEDNLQQLSYTLEPFSKTEQEDFLTKYWQYELKLQEADQEQLGIYAKELINKLAESISDKEKELTGIPLQIWMLADNYKREVKNFYQSDQLTPELPDKLDLLDLYEKFLKNKYNIFGKKGQIAADQQTKITLKDISIHQNHQRLALQVLFTEEQVNLLQPELLKPLLSKGKLARIGIARINDENKPQFIHRTFAEYFAADFLVNQLILKIETQRPQVQKFLLKQILLQEDYQVIRAFLNGLLKKVEFRPSEETLKQYGNRIDEIWREKHSLSNSDGTMLHRAVIEGNTYIISFLLDSLKTGEHTDTLNKLLLAKDSIKRTSFFLATCCQVEALEKLWDWGNQAKLSAKEMLLDNKDENESTVFFIAAWGKQVGVFDKLWELGKKELNSEDFKELLLDRDNRGQTVWHQAAKNGYVEVLKRLWEWGEETLSPEDFKNKLLLAKDKNGQTAWHYAAWGGQVEVLEKLWKWGKETKLSSREMLLDEDYDRQTVCHQAARNGYVEVLKKLWEWGKETLSLEDFKNKLLLAKDKNKRTAFLLAADNGHIEVLKRLWEWGKKTLGPEDFKNKLLLDKDDSRQTAFLLAAEKGHVELLDKLFEWSQTTLSPQEFKEMLLARKGNYTRSAFFLAAEKGHVELLDKLFEWSQTTLNSQEFEKLLLDKDNFNQTIWSRAIENGHAGVLENLWGWGEKMNLTQEKLKERLLDKGRQRNAWRRAAMTGRAEVFDELLKWSQAKLSSQELKELLIVKDIPTSWGIAMKNGHLGLLEKLWEWTQKTLSPQELKEMLLNRDEYEQTAFHLTVKFRKVTALEKLWEWGKDAKLSTKELKEWISRRDMYGRTALEFARIYTQGSIIYIEKQKRLEIINLLNRYSSETEERIIQSSPHTLSAVMKR